MKNDGQRSIFRVEAIRRYAQGADEAVLPQFTSPRTIRLLWVMIGLLLAGGLLLWLMRIPIYASAVAVPMSTEYSSYVIPVVSTSAANNQKLVAIFLPSSNLSRLRVGQRVFWNFSNTGQRVSRFIVDVQTEVISPDSLRQNFGLRGQAALEFSEPVVVAFVNLEPVPGDLPASAYAGSMYQADVEVGTRRVITLLPIVGRFFGD